MDLIRRLVKERAVNPQLSRGLGTGGKAVKRGGWRLEDPRTEPGIQAGHDSGSGAGLTEGVGPGAGGTREALRPCPRGSGQFTCHLLCLPERLGSALRRPPRVDTLFPSLRIGFLHQPRAHDAQIVPGRAGPPTAFCVPPPGCLTSALKSPSGDPKSAPPHQPAAAPELPVPGSGTTMCLSTQPESRVSSSHLANVATSRCHCHPAPACLLHSQDWPGAPASLGSVPRPQRAPEMHI